MSTSGHSAEVGDELLRRAVEVLRRRGMWGVAVAVFVTAASAVLVFTARPVYMADARLRLGEPPPSTGVSPTGGLLSFLRTGGDPFANDLELLSSRTLAEDVVGTGLLNVQLVAPSGWHRDSIFASLSQIDTTAKATFEASWRDDGTIRLEARSGREAELGSFRAGEPVEFGGLRAVFLPRKEGGPTSIEIKTVPFDEAVRVERGRMHVERTRREANVLDVSYTHHDPTIAERTVETMVGGFLELRMRLFQQESGETVDSLRAVARGTQEELRSAEDALEAIQRETGLVAPDAQSEALIERYETAYRALLEARTELDAIASQLQRVEAAEERIEAWGTLVAHPRFLENDMMGRLLERLTLLEELKTEALSIRTPGSREAGMLEAQITQLDGALRTVIKEYTVGLTDRVEELDQQLRELEQVLARLPAQVVDLGRRQRNVRLLSEVVVLTEQRLRQEELRQALAFSNVQIIDPPTLRYRPVWPRKKLGLAIGMLLAGLSGLATVVMVERVDTSVRRASTLRALTNAPVLAAPVLAGSALALDTDEVAAVRGENDGERIVVVLRSADRWSAMLGTALAVSPERLTRVDDYADAYALGSSPVVLAVAVGRTPEAEVRRVFALVQEAGGSIVGTVALCRSARDAEVLWK